jgi:LPXTG-motif cell wall-anchored protein
MAVLFVVLLLVALAVMPVAAQTGQEACLTASGQGQQAAFGANNWHTLCGQSAVFTFQYSGNDDPVQLDLSMSPANSVKFSVFTRQQWGDFGRVSDVEPVGRGTAPDSDTTDRLTWNGTSTTGETYFVLVEQTTTQNPGFTLTLSGSGGSGLRYVPASRPSMQEQPMLASAQPAESAGAPPLTLPVTGASALPMLLAAGSALITGGWLLRRRR